MSNKRFFVFIGMLVILFVHDSYGQELLKNNNWEKLKANVPVNWYFKTYKGQSTIKLESDLFKNMKVAVIDSKKLEGLGYIGQRTKIQLKAGNNVVLSGYYRTENIVLGPKGTLCVQIKYNYGSKDKKFPRKYQVIRFKSSEKWEKFELVRTLRVPVKDFFAFFMLSKASGKLYFSALSLKVRKSGKIDSHEKYIWREAEDIDRYGKSSTWGKEIKDYYSGAGGIVLKDTPFKWDFKIKEELNQATLMPKRRSYYVWLRIYGYLEKPMASVFFKKHKIYSFKTQANEKVNAQGKYAGPGKYYWQRAGTFHATGGIGFLNIVPQGRMVLDAIIVTTDSKYIPLQYEAKKAAEKIFFTNAKTPVMKSTYGIYGISDKVSTPLEFQYQGRTMQIPINQKPAIFHISLPANVKVKKIKWPGKTKKHLSWKKTRTRLVDGIQYNLYEIYLYYLARHCILFVQADKTDFQADRKWSCKYYLEYNGNKQKEETVPLHAVLLKPTKSFKTIMIGPVGGTASTFYVDFPNIVQDMVFLGLNVINPWHLHPDTSDMRWEKIRVQCLQDKITILDEFSPFHGRFGIKNKKFRAVSLTGEASSFRPMLCINKESVSFRKALSYLTNQGNQGALGVAGMIFDDEMFNGAGDQYDYNPITKEHFKKYVVKRGITYINPELVVKNKKKYARQYKAWVDFKCDCMVEMYRKYKKAYDKGLAKASRSITFGKKLFIAQIQRQNTTEESRIVNYWDYKKLAAVCDYISPMIYTYKGIKNSAQVGDDIERYHKYIGKKILAPTLLCEHSGYGVVNITQKKMYKYQIFECLMQQTKIIFFWHGMSSVFNPINSQYISEAIRWAAPYEDIILNGKEYNGAFSSQSWVRIKGLKLNKRILLYVANYRNSIDKKVKIKLKNKIKSVLEIGLDKQLPVKNNSFSVDFKSDRGKLFIISQ